MHPFHVFAVEPGATVVVSHTPRETYALRRLLVHMPPMFEDVALVLPPHGPLPLSEPRLSDVPNVVSWLVLGPTVWVTPQHSLELRVRNPSEEVARLMAVATGDVHERREPLRVIVDVPPGFVPERVIVHNERNEPVDLNVALMGFSLRPPLRMCNVCGHQTDKGAGREGNLCPLLSCPGELR